MKGEEALLISILHKIMFLQFNGLFFIKARVVRSTIGWYAARANHQCTTQRIISLFMPPLSPYWLSPAILDTLDT